MIFAMVMVSCAGLADRWLPPIPPPPGEHHPEWIYALAWAETGGEGSVPEYLAFSLILSCISPMS